jgi:hypothetical protein
VNRAPLAYLTAYLQSAVALLFLVGYFVMMAMLFTGRAKIPDNLLELAKTLAIALTNSMGLLFAFLYLRSRTDGAPDPATTTTQLTQTTVPIPGAPHVDPPTIAPAVITPAAGGLHEPPGK